MLGISPDAWREAREVMGEDAAAVTVAAILQRADHIRALAGTCAPSSSARGEGSSALGRCSRR